MATQYEAVIEGEGSGETFTADTIEQAWERAEEWARGGEWDDAGAVKVILRDADGEYIGSRTVEV